LIWAVWALVNASFAIILGFAAPFFVAQGMSPVRAAAITSLNLFVSLPVTPLGGWLLKRTVGVLPGIVLCLLGLTVATLLLPFGISPPALMISYGVLIGVVAGPMFAQAGEGVRPEERALGMSILFTIFYTGMAVAPPIAGLARDVTGDPAMPFYVAAFLMLATTLAQLAHARWRFMVSKQTSTIPKNWAA
jgi:MFS family permease